MHPIYKHERNPTKHHWRAYPPAYLAAMVASEHEGYRSAELTGPEACRLRNLLQRYQSTIRAWARIEKCADPPPPHTVLLASIIGWRVEHASGERSPSAKDPGWHKPEWILTGRNKQKDPAILAIEAGLHSGWRDSLETVLPPQD